MPKVWQFEPDQPPEIVRKKYVKRKANPANAWVAPEHARVASSMRRDYPRNERGEKLGNERFLVVDKRPVIMIPPRKTYLGFK